MGELGLVLVVVAIHLLVGVSRLVFDAISTSPSGTLLAAYQTRTYWMVRVFAFTVNTDLIREIGYCGLEE